MRRVVVGFLHFGDLPAKMLRGIIVLLMEAWLDVLGRVSGDAIPRSLGCVSWRD